MNGAAGDRQPPPSDPSDPIAALVFRYAECIDGGDFEGVADLLADAELTAGDGNHLARGRDAVLRQYQRSTRRYPDGTPHTKHVTSNLVVSIDGDEATARSSYTVFQAVPGRLDLQPIISGGYRDRFRRASHDQGWRVVARHIDVDLVGDLSAHLLFDLAPPPNTPLPPLPAD